MNKKLATLLLSSIMLPMPLSLQAQYHSQVWNPDNGNGTYTNPVLYAEDGDGCGEPYLTYHMPKSASHTKVNPQESDEFNSTELGLQWQWHANYNQLWGMPTNNGCLRLYTADLYHPASNISNGEAVPFKSLWKAGNLLLQKTPAKNFKATAKIRFASKEDDQYGGLIMMGMNW